MEGTGSRPLEEKLVVFNINAPLRHKAFAALADFIAFHAYTRLRKRLVFTRRRRDAGDGDGGGIVLELTNEPQKQVLRRKSVFSSTR